MCSVSKLVIRDSVVSCRGVRPLRFVRNGFALYSRSMATVSVLLTLAASCRGVLPLLLAANTLAPAYNSLQTVINVTV